MTRRGSRKQGPAERLREERAGLILRYTVDATEAEASKPEPPQREPSAQSPPHAAPTDYAIELDVAAGFLWWWSLFELIELGGAGTGLPSMAFRSPEPTASAGFPRLSRRAATRAGERAARKLSAQPDTAAATAWPSTSRPTWWPRRLVQSALILLAAAVLAAALVETRNLSHHARRNPLTPPKTTRSARHSTRQSLSTRPATKLNNEGYARMRRGDYAGALPLLEVAVRRLHGTGSVGEAYADFNLANTRYHLGRCTDVLALLEHSQQIQGPDPAIDNLRSAARKTCT